MAIRTLDQCALDQQIGFRIFQARRRKELTVLRLAARAHVHRNTIYRAESGMGLSVFVLARIANALEVSLDDLVPFSQRLVHFSKKGISGRKKAVKVVCGTENLFRDSEPGAGETGELDRHTGRSKGRPSCARIPE